jgi:hypothetical protein
MESKHFSIDAQTPSCCYIGACAKLAPASLCGLTQTPHQSARTGMEYVGECKDLGAREGGPAHTNQGLSSSSTSTSKSNGSREPTMLQPPSYHLFFVLFTYLFTYIQICIYIILTERNCGYQRYCGFHHTPQKLWVNKYLHLAWVFYVTGWVWCDKTWPAGYPF